MRGRGALAIGDYFCNAFIFGDRMHGLTCLGGIKITQAICQSLSSTLDYYTKMT